MITNGKDLNIIGKDEIAEGWVRVDVDGVAYTYCRLKDGRVFEGVVDKFTLRNGKKFKDGEWSA